MKAENRLNLLFQHLIQLFANASHPLVIFLDDLQWIDSASLKLLKILLSGGLDFVLFIGAYRDSEVSDHLEETYPELLPYKSDFRRKSMLNNHGVTSLTSTETRMASALDLTTVVKASQALSGEIVLDKLLAKLITIVLENAGAQKGFLILEQNGELVIEAAGGVDGSEISVRRSLPIEKTKLLPKSIVNYVARTHEYVVFNDATKEYVQTDESKLRQVLINLLSNGIKFTQQGWVKLSVTMGQNSADSLQFQVKDSGPGIESDETEDLFAPFVQTDTGRKSIEGTGLGLFISRQFVRLCDRPTQTSDRDTKRLSHEKSRP
jgi:hypothetical protein